MLLVYTGSDQTTLTFDFVDEKSNAPRLVVVFDRDPPDVHWYYISEDDSDHGEFNPETLARFHIDPVHLSPEDQAEVDAFVDGDAALAILIADTGLVVRDV